MLIIRIIELSALVLLAYFLLMQVIVPACMDRKLFPLLRKTGDLEKELVSAKQEVADAELAAEVAEIRSKTAEVKEVKNETTSI